MADNAQTLHIDQELTDVSIAYYQSRDDFIHDKVCAPIGVTKQSDRIRKITAGTTSQVQDDTIAPGQPTGEIRTTISRESYFCEERGRHMMVLDVDAANNDISNLEMQNTMILTQRGIVTAEKVFANEVLQKEKWGNTADGADAATAANAFDYTDDNNNNFVYWNAANAKWKEDIDAGKRRFKLVTDGLDPNIMIVGRDVFDWMKRDDDMIDVIKYGGGPTSPATVTRQAIASDLQLDDVLVANAVQNLAGDSESVNISFISSNFALLLNRNMMPGINTPMSVGCFNFGPTLYTGSAVENMLMFITRRRDDDKRGEKIEYLSAYDFAVLERMAGVWFDKPLKVA